MDGTPAWKRSLPEQPSVVENDDTPDKTAVTAADAASSASASAEPPSSPTDESSSPTVTRTTTGAAATTTSGGPQLNSPIVFLYDTFYNRLFEVAPSVRPLFKNDLRVQGRALVKMIATAVTLLEKVDTLVPALQQLTVRHGAYGAKTAHYSVVGEVLLYTLEKCLGPEEWTDKVATAWLTVYSVMMSVMIPIAMDIDAKADKAAQDKAQAAKGWGCKSGSAATHPEAAHGTAPAAV
jgi:hemoglobin-like flavoprotein